MNASALLGLDCENDSLEVLWEDAGHAFCRLRSNNAEGDRYAFIPIPSGARHPAVESINRLAHEYQLRDQLASEWALRPVELLRERGCTLLVVEFPRRPAMAGRSNT
jgi:hypothetical protein